MEAFLNPTRPTTSRMGKVSKNLPDDYVLYVTACNDRVKTTGDKTLTALPEHLWRSSLKFPVGTPQS
jgi:hypothetical protein